MAEEKYVLVKRSSEEKQHFSDGKEAGDAFGKTPGHEKPMVIKLGKGAQFVGSTAESFDRNTGEQVFHKTVSTSDQAFRQGWERAEQEKIAAAFERDRQSGITSGMMRIDGREVAEVRVHENRTDSGSKSYDVQYFNRRGAEDRSSIAQEKGVKSQDLAVVLGERNAETVRESNKPSITLAGDRLAYAQATSVNERDRQAHEVKQANLSSAYKIPTGETPKHSRPAEFERER